jgi:Flp pilus assembly protein TadD
MQAAASAAREFSPPEAQNIELSRAWRGLGYVCVEQGKLDDAEKMYRQCLDLDAKDSRAVNELQYIQGVRAKSGAR